MRNNTESLHQSSINILVCYHKNAHLIANEILHPIVVGNKIIDKQHLNALEQQAKALNVKLYYDDLCEKTMTNHNVAQDSSLSLSLGRTNYTN